MKKVKAYLHKLKVIVEKELFTWDIYFSYDIDDWEFGILGHEPFFENFKITFEYSNKGFVLER